MDLINWLSSPDKISHLEALIPWGSTVVVVAAILWVLSHLDKAESAIGRICGWGTAISSTFEKGAIAKDIQSRLSRASRGINAACGEVIPNGAKVAWVKEQSREAFFYNNQIIVKMDYHKNQGRNFAIATLLYLSDGLLPKTKPYLGRSLSKAMDLMVAKKMLIQEHQTALRYFYSELLDPEISNNPSIKKAIEQMNLIDERGLFAPILLSELLSLGLALYPLLPSEHIAGEITKFLEWLFTLANRDPGELVNTIFVGAHIRIGIVLVAKRVTVETKGIGPYLVAARTHIIKGADIVYLLAYDNNISVASRVGDELTQNSNITCISKRPYRANIPTGRRRGICIMLQTKNPPVEQPTH